jgi:hypothetical protein
MVNQVGSSGENGYIVLAFLRKELNEWFGRLVIKKYWSAGRQVGTFKSANNYICRYYYSGRQVGTFIIADIFCMQVGRSAL